MWFHLVLVTIDKRRACQSHKQYRKDQTKVYVTTFEQHGSLLLSFTCGREEDCSSGEEEVKEEEVVGNDQDVDDSAMEDDGRDKSSQEEDIEKLYDLKHYDSEEEDGPENMAGIVKGNYSTQQCKHKE